MAAQLVLTLLLVAAAMLCGSTLQVPNKMPAKVLPTALTFKLLTLTKPVDEAVLK